MKESPVTYKLGKHPKSGQPNITCKVCGRTSYSAGDIEYQYCGYCHQFHEFLRLQNKPFRKVGFLTRLKNIFFSRF